MKPERARTINYASEKWTQPRGSPSRDCPPFFRANRIIQHHLSAFRMNIITKYLFRFREARFIKERETRRLKVLFFSKCDSLFTPNQVLQHPAENGNVFQRNPPALLMYTFFFIALEFNYVFYWKQEVWIWDLLRRLRKLHYALKID